MDTKCSCRLCKGHIAFEPKDMGRTVSARIAGGTRLCLSRALAGTNAYGRPKASSNLC